MKIKGDFLIIRDCIFIVIVLIFNNIFIKGAKDMRKAVCVVIIENNRILLVKKNETWILPGGKPKESESDIDCLLRECKEELPKLNFLIKKYLNVFSGITPHKKDELSAEVYLASSNGNITPHAEISKAEWTSKPEEYNLSDITKKIVTFLREKKYLQA